MPTPVPASEALRALLHFLRAQRYAFVTVTPLTHARVLKRKQNSTTDLRGAFGWSRAFKPSLLPEPLLAQLVESGLVVHDGADCRSRVRVSSLEDMLFAHSAFPTDAGDAIFFGPDTYRFVGAINRELHRCRENARVVEIGCGTGAAGIVIARQRPSAEVILADINQSALNFAAVNAEIADAANVSMLYSDILDDLDGGFDFIVANPPYLVDPAHRSYRDGGGDWGAELSLRIVAAAADRLNAGGMALIYTGAAVVDGRDVFKHEAERLLRSARLSWSYEEIDPDVFGEELDTPAYVAAERIAAVALRLSKR